MSSTNLGSFSYGSLTTPAVIVPSGGNGDGIPTGMQSYLYTGGVYQQQQNAATLGLNAALANMYGSTNAGYQAGINANQTQFLSTANNLGMYQANAISNQGKGK